MSRKSLKSSFFFLSSNSVSFQVDTLFSTIIEKQITAVSSRQHCGHQSVSRMMRNIQSCNRFNFLSKYSTNEKFHDYTKTKKKTFIRGIVLTATFIGSNVRNRGPQMNFENERENRFNLGWKFFRSSLYPTYSRSSLSS